jgi:ribonuclease HI
MKKNEIIIYTDGSSLGNPGPGGWGSVLIFPDGKVTELGGREKESTNNRMEMTAAIKALEEISKRKPKAKTIRIYTDSSYLLNGITMWVYAWQKNNWLTKTKEAVLNKDLWEELFRLDFSLKTKYELSWEKVSGHSGVHLNERCDAIATSFAGNNTTILFTGNFKNYEKLFGPIRQAQGVQSSTLNKTISKNQKPKSKGRVAYAYISQVGGKIHSDKTWGQCEHRVKGKSGARYKKVFSKEEEQDLIAEWTLKSLL